MIPACIATVHPSPKDSAVDDLIDILHITEKALRRECTKDEICEIYVERDKFLWGKLAAKDIYDGHLLPDNRTCITDTAQAKPKSASSRKVAHVGDGELHTQEQRDTFRAELKRAAVKSTMKTMAAALIGGGMEAGRAVAAAMGKTVEGENEENGNQMRNSRPRVWSQLSTLGTRLPTTASQPQPSGRR